MGVQWRVRTVRRPRVRHLQQRGQLSTADGTGVGGERSGGEAVLGVGVAHPLRQTVCAHLEAGAGQSATTQVSDCVFSAPLSAPVSAATTQVSDCVFSAPFSAPVSAATTQVSDCVFSAPFSAPFSAATTQVSDCGLFQRPLSARDSQPARRYCTSAKSRPITPK